MAVERPADTCPEGHFTFDHAVVFPRARLRLALWAELRPLHAGVPEVRTLQVGAAEIGTARIATAEIDARQT